MRKEIPAIVAGEINQVLLKNAEYRDYIQSHVSNVEDAFMRYFVPIMNREHVSDMLSDDELYKAIEKARMNIQVHDASKYSDIEFDSYRHHFYPTESEKADPEWELKDEPKYKQGWLHHYKNNKHHPDHWASDTLQPFEDMPIEYVIEMLCDWLAMGVFLGTSTIDWYESDESEKEKGCMTDKTKSLVNEFLYKILPQIEEVP